MIPILVNSALYDRAQIERRVAGMANPERIGRVRALIMGIAGGALIPLLYGYLKEREAFGNNMAFVICMFPSYLYILYYSISGYKAGKYRKRFL